MNTASGSFKLSTLRNCQFCGYRATGHGCQRHEGEEEPEMATELQPNRESQKRREGACPSPKVSEWNLRGRSLRLDYTKAISAHLHFVIKISGIHSDALLWILGNISGVSFTLSTYQERRTMEYFTISTMASSPWKWTFRLYDVTEWESKKVLCQVLKWGTPRRESGKTFLEYLLLVKELSWPTLYRLFNQSQRKKINDKFDIESTYDISLLCLCIQHGCDGLAPPEDSRWMSSGNTLEWYVTSIQNYWDDFINEDFQLDETEFLHAAEKLKQLLGNTLERAAEIYNIDRKVVEDIVEELNQKINNIKDNPFQEPVGSRLYYKRICEKARTEGIQTLKETYRDEANSRLTLNLPWNSTVHVDKVFTTISMKQIQICDLGTNYEYINYEDLLIEAERKRNDERKDCTLLLVEGPAGVGKTTLFKKIISDWTSGTSTMKTLTDYEFAIYYECRDEGPRSLNQLLNSLMIKVSNKMQNQFNPIECIQQRKVLFIIDGVDELNSSSNRVLRQILRMSETDDMTVLCSTRPDKVFEFTKEVPRNFNIMQVKALGIEEKSRAKFFRNYSQVLQDQGIVNRDIYGLLWHLSRKDNRLHVHWQFPFNLILVAILWFFDPDTVQSLTTATDLFRTMHDFCTRRLLLILSGNGETQTMNSSELKEKVARFLKKFYEEAFINHCGDALLLSESSVQRLKEICFLLNLPPKVVLGAFLIKTSSLTDVEEKYNFPHKALQEFYSALHVVEILSARELGLNVPSIVSGLVSVLLREGVPQDLASSLISNCKTKLNEYQLELAMNPCSIRSVLEEATKKAATYNGKEENRLYLREHRDIIVHLLGLLYARDRPEDLAEDQNGVSLPGLLHRRDRPWAEERSTELVELLEAAGTHRQSMWLDLLSEVKCDATMTELLVKALDLTVDTTISDNHLDAFLHVLSYANMSNLILDITNNPDDLPSLRELLPAIGDKRWLVHLLLHHDYQYPKEDNSDRDTALQKFFQCSQAQVVMFTGQLSGPAMAAFPYCLHTLRLAVKDDRHYQEIQPALTAFPRRQSWLEDLRLHVPVTLTIRPLRPLPAVRAVSLLVPGVDEATAGRASPLVRRLQPSKGYIQLYLPGALHYVDAFIRLVKDLGRRKCKVQDNVVASPMVDDETEKRLEGIVRQELHCNFTATEDEGIWTYW
ncbi:uncharacterized protein LOC122255621 [Penaeus japonicus]|uniref:uncharacterized protein LOC122255621 n=1 Tax=Penaeus japonicus TaxID=27405 RepID=UPI001C712AC9|nr:uncharacterized protein LOC122255621 [Penaeus japonicus]